MPYLRTYYQCDISPSIQRKELHTAERGSYEFESILRIVNFLFDGRYLLLGNIEGFWRLQGLCSLHSFKSQYEKRSVQSI